MSKYVENRIFGNEVWNIFEVLKFGNPWGRPGPMHMVRHCGCTNQFIGWLISFYWSGKLFNGSQLKVLVTTIGRKMQSCIKCGHPSDALFLYIHTQNAQFQLHEISWHHHSRWGDCYDCNWALKYWLEFPTFFQKECFIGNNPHLLYFKAKPHFGQFILYVNVDIQKRCDT